MKYFIFALCFYSVASLANIAVVDGKPYELRPMEVPVCGEEGDASYTAATFTMNAAQEIGAGNAQTLCKIGANKEACALDFQKKWGVEQVFAVIRKFPSRYKSAGCLSLRNFCEKKCNDSKVFQAVDCTIECNQYESWNR